MNAVLKENWIPEALFSRHSRTVIEVLTWVISVLTVFFEPYVISAERNFTDMLCVLV